MSIGAIPASNPVTANGLSSAQSQPKAPADQATASTSATSTTTVASNVVAASKEANETAAQTAQEAGRGDHQAQLVMQKHQHLHQHPVKHQHVGAATPSKAPATGVVNGNGQITGELINTKA